MSFDQASHDLRAVVRSARTADEQRRHLYWTAAGGALAGMLLWAIVPGMLVRSAPQTWQWPERMAAHTLRLEPWAAGERMLARTDPERWQTVLFANRLAQENRQTIADCRRASNEAATPRQCAIIIAPEENR